MFLTYFRRISKGTLERSSINLGSIRHESGCSPKKDVPHLIVTLDPNKFVEKKQQCLHISNLQSFSPRISLLKQSSPVLSLRIYYDRAPRGKRPSFPPDTKAFLYYFKSPKRPRITGELRFRVTPSDDPASFESGFDLLRTNGRIWSYPLYALLIHRLALYEKLREDELVPDDLDKAMSTLPSLYHIYPRSQLIYTLNDTFIVDFSSHTPAFFAITEQGIKKIRFNNIFYDYRQICMGNIPYTGSALARFERSTLIEHKDRRIVVLRFLKIITPVKCVMPLYDEYIRLPKEGELYGKRTKKTPNMHQPWSVDIDNPKGDVAMIRGLQLLWDT